MVAGTSARSGSCCCAHAQKSDASYSPATISLARSASTTVKTPSISYGPAPPARSPSLRKSMTQPREREERSKAPCSRRACSACRREDQKSAARSRHRAARRYDSHENPSRRCRRRAAQSRRRHRQRHRGTCRGEGHHCCTSKAPVVAHRRARAQTCRRVRAGARQPKANSRGRAPCGGIAAGAPAVERPAKHQHGEGRSHAGPPPEGAVADLQALG